MLICRKEVCVASENLTIVLKIGVLMVPTNYYVQTYDRLNLIF